MEKIDCCFLVTGNSSKTYQSLSKTYSAIEPPTWALLLAQSTRTSGFKVKIIDANAENLSEIDIYKRPIHCSDMKREIMYVRDNDVWEKENTTYDKLRKAIKYITKKNGDLLVPWSEKHPSCMNIEHPQNDIYMRIMSQAMGGKEEFTCSENKIIKKISKAVIIDKM